MQRSRGKRNDRHRSQRSLWFRFAQHRGHSPVPRTSLRFMPTFLSCLYPFPGAVRFPVGHPSAGQRRDVPSLRPRAAGTERSQHPPGAEPTPCWAQSLVPRKPSPSEWVPSTPRTAELPFGSRRAAGPGQRSEGETGELPGAQRAAGLGTPPAGTLAAGAALQDDDRRLVQPLGAAAGGAQLAQVGVGVGIAAAHRLAAGAHTEAGLRAPPHGGRGGHPEGHHALQPLAARALLQAARGSLGRAAHLAAAARVADAAALTGSRRRGAARELAALRTLGGGRRRAAGPKELRRDGRREQQQQQQQRERGARGLHGGSDGGGALARAGEQRREERGRDGEPVRVRAAARPSPLALRR